MSAYNVIILMNHEHQIKCGKMIDRCAHGQFVSTIPALAWTDLNISLGTCTYKCPLDRDTQVTL
jgi:hypothetical protein